MKLNTRLLSIGLQVVMVSSFFSSMITNPATLDIPSALLTQAENSRLQALPKHDWCPPSLPFVVGSAVLAAATSPIEGGNDGKTRPARGGHNNSNALSTGVDLEGGVRHLFQGISAVIPVKLRISTVPVL